MMLLAVPIILGPLMNASVGLRMLIGAFIGFTFYVANRGIGAASLAYNFSSFWAAILPSIIVLFIGLFLIKKYN